MEPYEPLRLFLHLARTLHFGKTSAECHVSPSTLSRVIQRLERDAGATLFVRDRRTVELTAEGERFREHAFEVIESWSAVQRELRQPEGLAGSISIFCTVTASQSILPAALARFREEHPGVQIRLETGYATGALDMLDEVDVTFAALPDRLPAGLVTRTMAVTPLMLVAPGEGAVARGAERKTVDWSRIPMILPPFGLAREMADRWFREQGVRPEIYTQAQGHEAILSLIALGCGVGVVPQLVLESSALRGRVRPLEVRPRLGEIRVGACTRRSRLASPVIGALWDAISRHPVD